MNIQLIIIIIIVVIIIIALYLLYRHKINTLVNLVQGEYIFKNVLVSIDNEDNDTLYVCIDNIVLPFDVVSYNVDYSYDDALEEYVLQVNYELYSQVANKCHTACIKLIKSKIALFYMDNSDSPILMEKIT